MERNQAQSWPSGWNKLTIGVAILSIALIAWGQSLSVDAQETGIELELIALTDTAEHAALTSGTSDAAYTVAFRIVSAPNGLNTAQLGDAVEASLAASFDSFESFDVASETVFTAFFAAQEDTGEIADSVLPAFQDHTETTVSVRTDPESGRNVHLAE